MNQELISKTFIRMKGVRIFTLLALAIAAVIILISARLAAAVDSRRTGTSAEKADRIAIERLHRQDVEATLSDKADGLTKLWDNEAVRIQPGHPAEIGKAEIYANDKRWEAKPDRPKTLCYKSEIKDVRIAGDWAFEWGYISYRDSSNPKPMRGKVLRVMKRQPDGSWKFARVIVFDEPKESAAPMSDPCQ
jgi:ketosteroid isomerase-like protein